MGSRRIRGLLRRLARAAALALATLAGVSAAAAGAAEDVAPAPAATLTLAVHPGLPPLTLLLFAGDDGVFARVLDARTRVVQEIPSDEAAEPARIPALRIEDLNFDGYLDLGLPTFAGATGNLGEAIWLFSPAQGAFVRNAVLSGTSRLTVDPARRELTSRWSAGHAGGIYTLETFRCPDGVPTLVRREKVDFDGAAHVKTIEELRDGAMKLVTREILEPSGGE